MLLDQTRRYIENLSDEELIEYLVEGIYEPEAIEFAKAVATSRRIEPQRFDDMQSRALQKLEAREAHAAEAATPPLGSFGKFWAFTSGIGLLGIGGLCLLVAWLNFRDRGETLRYKQMWHCARWGFVTFWAEILLLALTAYCLITIYH